MNRHSNGFTLVELSIVLVIIGLLVGGVLAGQSLIHAAEMRAVSSEYQQFQTAFGAFRDKYFAVPGDMPNAVKYWGAQAGATTDGKDNTCAGLDYTTPATGTATCNGNGDGKIGEYGGSGVDYERLRAWQHLANAGLVAGSFTAVLNASGALVAGSNVPSSKFNRSAVWLPMYFTPGAPSASYHSANYRNTLLFGGILNAYNQVAIVKPEDAYYIDMKVDDGKPNTGNVLTYTNSWHGNCVPASNDQYSLSNTQPSCAFLFITGY